MSFKDHYSDRAAGYAAHRPRYPLALAELLAAAAPGRAVAWEAGCGSGQLSVVLGELFERVIATDASAEQLAFAVPHPRVEYRAATAEASGLADSCADLVVAAQAAHWFDLERYYAEVRRVARTGAAVALVSYGVVRIDSALDTVLDRFHDEALGPWWPPERRHVVDGYRSIPFPFEEMDAPAILMRAEWTSEELLSYVDTWSAVRALQRAGGRDVVARFRREIEAAWGATASRRPLAWPLVIRLGRTSK